MKTAYVICNNDSIEAVIIDDFQKARSELIRLKEDHHKLSPKCDGYSDIYFWHIHEVPVIE